jgi:hypothetical protein
VKNSLFKLSKEFWRHSVSIMCVYVFVYDPSYTEFLLPTSSSGLITFIRPKEHKLWCCYQNRPSKRRHIRTESCGGPCVALRNVLNCFIGCISIRGQEGFCRLKLATCLSLTHSIMLVLFRHFQLCHDQHFPPLGTDGSQPFIVHT